MQALFKKCKGGCTRQEVNSSGHLRKLPRQGMLSLFLALAAPAWSQEPHIGQAEPHVMTEEIRHSYTVYPYQPQFVLDARSVTVLREEEPESALNAWIGAMRAGQYDLAMSCWDVESQRQISERDKALGKQPSQWLQQWKRLFGNSKVVLSNKIKYGKYWMITYTATDPAGQVLIHETVALGNSKGKWKLTLALADNAVLNNWESGKTRIERLAAPQFKSRVD
ncbi:hypothetical protein [Pseudoduganella sp. RAF53_2]|uniref:hypothetical protein n=1 Tax=unclassified Pseudoduganella TaxID=2637179 RepID=UPI003F965AD2